MQLGAVAQQMHQNPVSLSQYQTGMPRAHRASPRVHGEGVQRAGLGRWCQKEPGPNGVFLVFRRPSQTLVHPDR